MAAIASMTGAGFAAGDSEIGPVRVEVRSVNGRGLSVKLRLPAACSGFESAVDQRLRAEIARGSVVVVMERTAPSPALPDADRLRATAEQMVRAADELGLDRPSLVEVVHAASAGGRVEAMTSRPLPERLGALVDEALAALVAHRRVDGAGTKRAIEGQLDELEQHTEAAAARAPAIVAGYRERLLARVEEFVAAHVPAPPPAADLVREVAVFADRVDVAEELQRLRTHAAEVRAVLKGGGEVGRRLDFLMQELLRETNTLGSKSPDAQTAHTVVAMKGCIATIKEQVANLE
ncbi:MAG: YicC/YloC family endoribonuclease [Planctomycetota bacterium]